MVTISGILKNASGVRPNTKIILTAYRTTSDVVTLAPDTTIITDTGGAYSFVCNPSFYSVRIQQSGYPCEKVGIIQIYSDSVDGTINDFLTNLKPDDLTPEILKQCIAAREGAEAAQKAAEEAAKNAADEYSQIFQDRFNLLLPVPWTANTQIEVKQQLQVFEYEKLFYLPDPQQLPFNTGATFDSSQFTLNELVTAHQMRTDSASQLGGVYEKDYVTGDTIPADAMKGKLMYWHNGQFYSVGTNAGFTSNDFDADLAAGYFVSASVIKGYINTEKLKESSAKLGEVVTTDCYLTLFDGGGATYEITDMAEQPTRTINLNSGLFACLRESRDDFHIERAGCVDGSSVDITACILDALRSYVEDKNGCVIHFGQGTRRMYTPFVLNSNSVARENVVIRGAGKFISNILNKMGANTVMFATNISGAAPSPVDGFEAHDFRVENPLQGGGGCCGFNIIHDARLRMSNIATKNFSNYGKPDGTNRLADGKWVFGTSENCGIRTLFTVGAVIDKCQDTGSGIGMCNKSHSSYGTTTTYINYYYSQQCGVGQCVMNSRGVVLTGCINENCFSGGMTHDDGGVAFYNYECPDLVMRDCWSELTNYYIQSSRNAFTYFDGGAFVDPRPYSKCFHIDNPYEKDYFQFVNTRIGFDSTSPPITVRAQYINTQLNVYAKQNLTLITFKPSYHADGDDFVMRQNLLLTRNNINATCKTLGFKDLATKEVFGFSMPAGDNKITCNLDLVLADDKALTQEFMGVNYRLGRNSNGDAVWVKLNV